MSNKNFEREHPLIARFNDSKVKNLSTFADEARKLSQDRLESDYETEKRNAPKRSGKYFVDGHDGTTNSGSKTNRHEAHFARALFNKYRRTSPRLTVPGIKSLRFFDYEVPLKLKLANAGIGKIDLFGITGANNPTIIEVKYCRTTPTDSPLKALLQALAYCAVVDKNFAAFHDEAKDRGVNLDPNSLTLVVLANNKYWDYYRPRNDKYQWVKKMGDLKKIIESSNKLKRIKRVEFLSINVKDGDWKCGLNRTKPEYLAEAVLNDALA